MAIYLQRHGESETNKRKLYTCRRLDPGLSETGVEQIRSKVSFYRDKNITRIISSPSRRAAESASILSVGLGRSVEVDGDLLEVDLGDLEGQSELEETRLDYFFEVMEAWHSGSYAVRFLGGESGEEVLSRVARIQNRYFDMPGVILVGRLAFKACYCRVPDALSSPTAVGR